MATSGGKKRIPILIIVMIVLMVGLVMWNYRTSWAAANLTVDSARQDLLKHEKQVKAVFANTEIILNSPAEGRITLPEEDGLRFRKDDVVARVTPTGIDYSSNKGALAVKASSSGLFYSVRDSLEQIITPENLMNMELNSLLSQAPEPQTVRVNQEDPSSLVNKYSPIGKIVNNLYPSWMFIYLEATDTMHTGDSAKFTINQEEYTGTVMRVSNDPKGAVIRLSQYVTGSTEQRTQDILWSYNPAKRGVLIPLSAVCTFGEEKSVYIVQDNIVRYRSIRIIDSNHEEACVEGITEGTQVVTNPKKGIEGWSIKSKI